MALRTISSIVKEAEEQTTPKKQAQVLKNNSSAALKMVIGCALDPKVKWLLPNGDPPYRPLPKAADAESRLYTDARMIDYLVDSAVGKQVTQIKREQIFTNLLESVDPDDAVLLIRCKDKKLNIAIEAVKQAFPNMTKDW